MTKWEPGEVKVTLTRPFNILDMYFNLDQQLEKSIVNMIFIDVCDLYMY